MPGRFAAADRDAAAGGRVKGRVPLEELKHLIHGVVSPERLQRPGPAEIGALAAYVAGSSVHDHDPIPHCQRLLGTEALTPAAAVAFVAGHL